MKFSVTLAGLLTLVVSRFLSGADIPFDQDLLSVQIAGLISLVGTVVGAALVYWGRYRLGDITWYGKVKKVPGARRKK